VFAIVVAIDSESADFQKRPLSDPAMLKVDERGPAGGGEDESRRL
jgi:hypothetical protein